MSVFSSSAATSPVEIRSAGAHDIKNIAALLGGVFGPHPEQELLLARWLADPARALLVAATAQEMVGFAAGVRQESSEMTTRHAHFAVDWASLTDPNGGPTTPWGSLMVLAVAPSQRRRGLGNALGQHLMDALSAMGCGRFVAVSWAHGGSDNSASLLNRAGWRCVATSHTFYPSQTQASGRRCSRCEHTCCCVALLYISEA